MPGFGEGPFGSGAFGEWPWSLVTIVRAPPAVHRDQDDAIGDGVLKALLEGLSPSLDGLRRKVRDWDDLRDPLKCPAEDGFQRPVTILKSVNLGDGTSQIFISEGTEGGKLDGLRPGMVLIDFRRIRFTISRVVISATTSDVSDPPIDPATGAAVARHFIVDNIAQASAEFIPFASGTIVVGENPVDPTAFPNDPLGKDDGTAVSPYVFDLDPTAAYTSPVSIARNRVELTWTEGSVAKSGFFTNAGLPGGDVDDNSTVDFDLGQIVLYTVDDGTIDADTIRVDYTTVDSPLPEDGEIRAQNILAFLASDYGITLDQDDPIILQRSYVHQAYQLWDIKGTVEGYSVLGEIAGYFVQAKAMNSVLSDIAASLPVADVFEIPVGSGSWFTTLDPDRGRFDEVALDVVPLDLLCIDATYPETAQAIDVTSVTFVQSEGSRVRNRLVIAAAAMEESFGTEGTLVDFSGSSFEVENFSRIDATSYQVEVSTFGVPVTGVGTMTWKVLKFVAPNTVTLTGLGTDIEDRGFASSGSTGKRWRITKTFTDPSLADVRNWVLIDSDGVRSFIELFEDLGGGTFRFEVIATSVPASGAANIFYDCEIVTDCDFCRASALFIRISPTTILNFPEALEGDALDRLIIRLNQMIPAHVRIKAFLFDPGPALAAWGITASSTIFNTWSDDALFSAFYDEDEFPADAIPTDSAPIIATSEVTITNENVLEEYLSGDDPLVAGTWTATGFWQVIQYRSSTQYRSFNFGYGDVGRVGDAGAVAPIYDDGAGITGVLTSPTIAGIGAATTVTLRFRHYGDMRAGGADDVVAVRIMDVAPAVTVRTITKADLALFATGTTGGVFFTVTFDITADVVGIGDFFLEFEFAMTTAVAGSGEGWYIDDIEVQVTP